MDSSVTDLSDTSRLEVLRDNSAGPAAAKTGAEKSTAGVEPAAACPRCGGKLTNPEGLGWCPACGYCRSLAQDADKAAFTAPAAARRPSALGAVEFLEVLAKLPQWLWMLLGGMTIVAVISLAANLVLPEDSLPRALWCTIQLGAGLFGLLAAQIWSFMLLAPQSEHLSAKDLILSARLWSMTCRRLPDTQRQLWLGGWSMAAMLCAVLVVGGFSYWYQFYKPKKIADKNLIAAIAEAARKKVSNKSLEESLDEFANSQDLTKKKEDLNKDKDPKVDKRPTVECVIIGYSVQADKELRKDTLTSLVLATVMDGRLQYAGQVRRGFNSRVSDELLKRLPRLVQQDPFIPGLNIPVIWVKPQVLCEVHQSGFDRDGRLVDPNFKELLTDQ